MRSFDHSVCEIEHSNHRVVIEETRTTGDIWRVRAVNAFALADEPKAIPTKSCW